MNRTLENRWMPLLVFAAAYLLCCLYAVSPYMGDDIDYYGYALFRHLPHPLFPPDEGFHFLRWPVWGLIWLYQGATQDFGFGGYAFVPRLCLALSCALVFVLGRAAKNPLVGLLAAILLLFHPLMDDLLARPMPDITEGVLATLAFLLFWFRLHTVENGGRLPLWRTVLEGVAFGVIGYAAWANRPSGMIFVIALGMLSLTRPRVMLPLFVIAVPVGVLCFYAEASLYQKLFGDFYHNWHANQGAAGKKGTEEVSLLKLPFRFVSAVAGGGLKGILVALAGIGGWQLWRGGKLSERWLVAWTVLLYLGIACAIQSLHPVRPLVREGERFVGNVALPLCLLAAPGLLWVVNCLRERKPKLDALAGWRGVALLLVVLAVASTREKRNLDLLHDVAAAVEAVPAGQRVRIDGDFFELANLSAPSATRERNWSIFSRNHVPTQPELLKPDADGGADWLFICRPRVMVTARKKLEGGKDLAEDKSVDVTKYAQDLLGKGSGWELKKVLFRNGYSDEESQLMKIEAHSRMPEFFVYAKRTKKAAWLSLLPQMIEWQWSRDTSETGDGEWGYREGEGLVFKRTKPGQAIFVTELMTLPPDCAGRALELRFQIDCARPEPGQIHVGFFDANGKGIVSQTLRTYAGRDGQYFYDFNGIEVPQNATQYRVLISAFSSTKAFTIRDVITPIPAVTP